MHLHQGSVNARDCVTKRMHVLVLADPVSGLVEPRFLARRTSIASTCTRGHRYLAQYCGLRDNIKLRPRPGSPKWTAQGLETNKHCLE